MSATINGRKFTAGDAQRFEQILIHTKKLFDRSPLSFEDIAAAVLFNQSKGVFEERLERARELVDAYNCYYGKGRHSIEDVGEAE